MENTAPIRHTSATEGNVFVNCNVKQQQALCRRISRLSSNESTECPASIFDYHSAHPSVELDDFCSDAVGLDETATDDCFGAEENTHGKSIAGNVIRNDTEPLRNAVMSSQLSEVTANTDVNVKFQSVAASVVPKSKLPQCSSGLPVCSSRMQSRLPAPRAATKVASGIHYASKSEQLVTGLTNGPVSSVGLNASSKVSLSRFH